MKNRWLVVLSVLVATALVTAVNSPLIAQQAGPLPLVITAYNGGPPIPFTAPKTPWGEPDLQGVWSSDDNDGIPMSRPTQFGNRLYQTEQELSERADRIQRGVRRAENEATSTFRGDFGRRAFPQTSLIVDPADGRLPAYTAEGQKRPMPRGTYGNGPLDWTTDFSLYERCITRGILGSTPQGG